MLKILQSYKKRLTNLSSKNRSILLLKLLADQFADLKSFDFLLNKPSFEIIDHLIAGKKATLCAVLDSRDVDTNVESRRLRKIKRVEKFIFEEQGAKDLYVGWPFVHGKFANGNPVRCALLYFPVDLIEEGGFWHLKPRKSDGITLNKAFFLAYGYHHGIKISDELLDKNLEEFDSDSTVFRSGLYQLLKEYNIEINFNQDTFTDKLIRFTDYKKADYEDITKEGELKLIQEAVLGIFPQSGSNLVPDYDQLIEGHGIEDLEEFFMSRTIQQEDTSEYRFLSSVHEEKTFTPFKLDAYQENAIKGVKKGNSMVVQGPPGTGKSQLICNLVSDFIARGKNVLVVSQKRAALDVVFERLSEKNLTDFIGLVHDFRNDRKDIYDKISRQIRHIDEYEHQNNSLDTIPLERNFLQVSRRIDQLCEELTEYKTALFDESECGISAKELYLTSSPNLPTINLRQEYRNFQYNDLEDFLKRLEYYAQYGVKFNRTEYALLDRMSFSGYGVSDLKKIEDILDDIPEYQEQVGKSVYELTGVHLNLEDCEALLLKRHKIIEMVKLLEDNEVYRYFQQITKYSDQETDLLSLSNTERVIMDCYKGEGPEMSLDSGQLGQFQESLQRTLDSRKGILKVVKWQLFSKDKFLIRRVLVANGLEFNKQGLQKLVEKIDNRLNLEHNITKLKEKAWLKDTPGTYEKLTWQNWFHLQKQSVKAKLLYKSIRHLSEFFAVDKLKFSDFRQNLEKLISEIYEITSRREIWELYLSKTQISNIINNPALGKMIKDELKKDFDALCEFDKLRDEFLPHEKEVIEKLISESSGSSIESLKELFLNSWKINWIDHIEMKYPVLRSVSSMKFRQMEVELQNKIREKMDISNEILLLKMRERTYENVELNRLNNRVTYRDLDHQVNKKRRIWPIRKLLEAHFNEVFNLVPCWLASPEAVSAMFPMEQIFDLIIFDEASQCFVEKGIPAMYRGRQIVIAGDHQQLQPNDLYRIRYDEEDEEDPALEITSVLDLASRYLMDVQLKGHYRSKSLELIDFSNKHFYNGGLKLLPDRSALNDGEPAIDFIKVEGVWENNTNVVEAEKVRDLIFDLIEKDEEKEIGVVTFNNKQQELIQDLLDEASIERDIILPSSLFVKNIENVQGDERDIIIFSTAYGPDAKGKIALNFGSLNVAGGENRLNVAISRAREKILIVTSLLPQNLKVDQVKNEGPKLLKEYIAYAKDVSDGKFVPTQEKNKHHRQDWFLKNKIIKESNQFEDGIVLTDEMPFADISVKKGKEFMGLIITDDDHLYNSVSIKESFVYNPFSFNKKNWQYRMIHSREFWQDKDSLLETLRVFMNKGTEG